MYEWSERICVALRWRAETIKRWAQPHSRQLARIAVGLCIFGLAVGWWADQVAKNIHQPAEGRWAADSKSQGDRSDLPGRVADKEPLASTSDDRSNKLLLDAAADVAQLKIAVGEQHERESEHYRELRIDLTKLMQSQRQTQSDADASAARLKAEVAQATQIMREEGDKIGRATTEQLLPLKGVQEKANESMTRSMQELTAKVSELSQRLEQQRAETSLFGNELAKMREALRNDKDSIDKVERDVRDVAAWRVLHVQATESSAKSMNDALGETRMALRQIERDLQASKVILPPLTVVTDTTQMQLAGIPAASNAKRASLETGTATDVSGNREISDRASTNAPSLAAAHEEESPRSRTSPLTVDQTSAPGAAGSLDADRLISRARRLIQQGNIAMARMMLEHAAETGNARAMFELAETYDPSVLSSWGTFGTQGDRTRAQELYAKAFAGGVIEAKERMNTQR